MSLIQYLGYTYVKKYFFLSDMPIYLGILYVCGYAWQPHLGDVSAFPSLRFSFLIYQMESGKNQ